MLPSSEIRPTINQVVPGGFADLTPWRCTTSGRLAMASWSLFCTWAQARSGSVPGAKVSSMREEPDESLVAGQVQHLVEAGHLLLDDLRDAVLHRLRRRPRIKGGDGDGRGSDGRILRYGQLVDRQAARHHQDDGDDPGEDRTLQEESR